jgi:membrane fusion protein (multidrug efflux system)
VLAPISGRVLRSSAMPGALVVPYQTSLATIQQLDPIYVDITRPAVEVLRLKRALAAGKMERPGAAGDLAKVGLVFEDGTPYPHPGELQFADAIVDPDTGNVTLRAIFPNPEKELLPGMYVRALLEEGVVDNAILVPQQGVTRDPRGTAMAMVVNGEGVVEPRMLEVDRTIGDQWLVTSGIEPGAKVIVEGLQKVRPGAKAAPVPFDPDKGATAPAPATPPGEAGAAPAAEGGGGDEGAKPDEAP